MNIEAIKKAIESFDFSKQEMRRIFHGRGHFYAGQEHINLDWYAPHVLIILYDNIEDTILEQLGQILQTASQSKIKGIVVQQRNQFKSPTRVYWGEPPKTPHYISENGLSYQVNLLKNQNTGFFPDMANGRKWLRTHAQGKRILNLFAYTCSLSVAALSAGAEFVVNVDMSKSALATGRKNHQLNNIDTKKVKFLPYNIFKSWSGIRKSGPYDLIIMDPPEFQKGSFSVEKDYSKLIKRIPELMPNGGQVFAALNSPNFDSNFLVDLFKTYCPDYTCQERINPPPAFKNQAPEKGLKLLIFTKTDNI